MTTHANDGARKPNAKDARSATCGQCCKPITSTTPEGLPQAAEEHYAVCTRKPQPKGTK